MFDLSCLNKKVNAKPRTVFMVRGFVFQAAVSMNVCAQNLRLDVSRIVMKAALVAELADAKSPATAGACCA